MIVPRSAGHTYQRTLVRMCKVTDNSRIPFGNDKKLKFRLILRNRRNLRFLPIPLEYPTPHPHFGSWTRARPRVGWTNSKVYICGEFWCFVISITSSRHKKEIMHQWVNASSQTWRLNDGTSNLCAALLLLVRSLKNRLIRYVICAKGRWPMRFCTCIEVRQSN